MSKNMIDDKLSAWLDGELTADEMPAPQDPAARSRCAVWWLIGDAVRNEPVLSPGFTARVMSQLDAEPTVFAPLAVPKRSAEAHQPLPRWAALAASLAGVAIVAWVVFGGKAVEQGAVPQPVIARAATEVKPVSAASRADAETAAVVASRSPIDDDRSYLLAHQAFGPGVQMAGLSGYVRPVSMDESLPAR